MSKKHSEKETIDRIGIRRVRSESKGPKFVQVIHVPPLYLPIPKLEKIVQFI